MNCEEVIDLFLAQKENEDAAAKAIIDNHLKSCDECRRKIEEMDFLLAAMDAQPQPQPPVELSEQFAAYLKTRQTDRAQVTIVRTLSKQLWVAAGLILIVGLAILFVLVNQKTNQRLAEPELVQKTGEPENLFSNASASVRIQAITQIDSLSVNQKLLKTLSKILLNDRNANVRMAALYSLSIHLSNPAVYEVFIEALATEKDPMLQVLLINTISQQKSPKSVEAIQSLIDDSATRTEVRTVAKQTIKTL